MFAELLEPPKTAPKATARLRAGDIVGIPDEDAIHYGRIVALEGEWSLVRVEDEEGIRELRVRRSSLCRLQPIAETLNSGRADVEGFYSLTKGRDLRFGRLVDPDSVRSWRISSDSKLSSFWRIAVEARALGLSEEETRANMSMWGLDEGNGVEFCKSMKVAAEKMEGGWLVAVARGRKKDEVPGPPVSKFEVGATLVEALAELAKPGLLVSA